MPRFEVRSLRQKILFPALFRYTQVERHDAQYAGHVVRENVQRHFGGYPWQRLRHQYVRV